MTSHRTPPGLLIVIISVFVSLIVLIGSHSASENNDQHHQHNHDDDFQEETSHQHNHDSDKTGKQPPPKDKVLLTDVKTLTFTRHKRTTSRRTHSIHQLSCVGGTAGCKLFTPTVVECLNNGLDKSTGKQQWLCHADMSDRVKFSHVEVICEGYDYPEDDYILLGSCGLEFTLDYVDPHDYHDQSYFKHMDDHEKELHHERVRAKTDNQVPLVQSVLALIWSYIFSVTVLVLVILVVLVKYLNSTGAAAASSAGPSLLDSRGGHVKKHMTAGVRGNGYGPLTSAVMATKKAC